MNNSTIALENIVGKSTDDIIEMYRNGYKLEESYDSNTPYISSTRNLKDVNVKYLQTDSVPIATMGLIFIAGIAAGALTIMLLKK